VTSEENPGKDFIRSIVSEDVKNRKNDGRVHTRFPPEPTGYLHVGHAKAFILSFSIAEEFGGKCNLRFDDTNPEKEKVEFEESIEEDIRWMGFDWKDRLYYASDYFERLYDFAVELVKKGKAYVDSLSADEIREYRGTLTEPGRDSPFRERTVEENLDLLERMKAGEFDDGAHVLRAKIDMASPNITMRDPTVYRIRKTPHNRTGDAWCIYPMYDFTHCLSDAIEGITHSLCSLEFENNRPLYNWFLGQLDVPSHPRQIEFARLNLNYTVMGKRKLVRLVDSGHVKGWDDPRLPTLAGMRRRGYTPQSIRRFIDRIGVSKVASTVDVALLEHVLRKELNETSPRVMAVLRPLKIVILNYPEGKVEWLEAENNPGDAAAGSRKIPFSRELFIEREDFREDPPRKYYRLAPGREIRLKHAYYIRCEKVIKEGDQVVELHCTYDPDTRGGWSGDGRIVRGTSHWVAAASSLEVEVRLYDHLFAKERPGEDGADFMEELNPKSVEVLTACSVEPSLAEAKPGARYQFLRQGYFCVDPDSTAERLVFNRTVSLVDTWAKIQKKQASEKSP
jgi:glutaminyl-tRNA synthetase